MVSLRAQLLHAAGERIYDPNERRQRYLRERQLKGRSGSGIPDNSGIQDNRGKDKGGKAPPSAPSGAPGSGPQSSDYLARVEALKVRLAEVKEVLAQMVEKAKVASGGEASDSGKTEPKKAAESEKSKDKTSAEKKEDAKDAKERRDKESPAPKAETAASLQAQIAAAEKQIQAMRAKLAAAAKAGTTKKKSAPDRKLVSAGKDKPEVNPSTAPEGRHH